MITSLRLMKRNKVNIGESGGFSVNGNKLNIKGVPFVRYNFGEYEESDVEYIKDLMKKFRYSVHLLEVDVEKANAEVVNKLVSEFESLAVYLYINVYDEDVSNIYISAERMNKAKEFKVYDRVMMRDKSVSLYAISANKLKRQISNTLGVNEMEVGICESPLSVGSDCCINAIQARDLAASYGLSPDCALPSSNHQDMKRCGCIRFETVEEDIVSVSKSSANKKSSSGTSGKSSSKPKVPKGAIKAW